MAAATVGGEEGAANTGNSHHDKLRSLLLLLDHETKTTKESQEEDHHDDDKGTHQENHTIRPPDVFQGQPRWIPHPQDVQNGPPRGWDEEDDGVWEPRLIPNPEYQWEPPPPPMLKPKPKPKPITNNASTSSTSSGWKHVWNHWKAELATVLPWVNVGILMTGLWTSLIQVSSFWGPLQELLVLPKTKTTNPSSITNLGRLLFTAALGGLMIPLCSCGALSLAVGLVRNNKSKNNGTLSLAMAFTFLIASQSAGIDSAAMTFGLLGPMATVARLGGAMLLAVTAGMAIIICSHYSLLDHKEENHNNNNDDNDHLDESPSSGKKHDHKNNPSPNNSSTCKRNHKDHDPSKQSSSTTTTTKMPESGLLSLWNTVLGWNVWETAVEILPTVLLGLVLSTVTLHYWPNHFWHYVLGVDNNPSNNKTMIHSHQWLFVGAIRWILLLLAVPFQICEHATVTLTSSLLLLSSSSSSSQQSSENLVAVASPGLAYAFLLSAPAMNLPTLLFLFQQYHQHHHQSSGSHKLGSSGRAGAFWVVVSVILATTGTAMVLAYLLDAFQLDILLLQSSENNSHNIMASMGAMDLPGWFSEWAMEISAGLFVMGLIHKKYYQPPPAQHDGGDNHEMSLSCCATTTKVSESDPHHQPQQHTTTENPENESCCGAKIATAKEAPAPQKIKRL